jgi:hypothetical protein
MSYSQNAEHSYNMRRIKSSLKVWGKILTNENRIDEESNSRLNLPCSPEVFVVQSVI